MISEKTYPIATLSTTNPTWTDSGLHGERPGTNRLSQGTAQLYFVSELLPLTDILFIPQIIWVWRPTVEWYWQGKTEGLGEKHVPMPLLSITNPTWIDPGANSGLRDERPATNLNHGTAQLYLTLQVALLFQYVPASLATWVLSCSVTKNIESRIEICWREPKKKVISLNLFCIQD
jgi:hypothetical protein